MKPAALTTEALTVRTNVPVGVTIATLASPSGNRTWRHAANDVLPFRHGFQVRGVYTSRVATEMVKVQTCGDRAKGELIRDAMCKDGSLRVHVPNLSVSMRADRRCPKPARLGLLHFRPKTCLKRSGGGSHLGLHFTDRFGCRSYL